MSSTDRRRDGRKDGRTDGQGESSIPPLQYGRQAAILKVTSLKIDRLLPIYISIVPLKFAVDIESQTKVRVRKPKIPIWLPGGHFEINIAENQ